jgi:ABC-type antimicrobial peptide transport system permease subunit
MNAGTTMRARSDVRSRKASLIAVTLIIGIAGAVSMAAFTGATRVTTAYPRYRAYTNEPAVIIFGGPNCPFSKNLDLDTMETLPQVMSMQPVWNTFVNVSDQQGNPLIFPAGSFDGTLFSADLTAPDSVRPLLLSGRFPRSVDEAVVGLGDTGAPRPAIGDTVDVSMVKIDSIDSMQSGDGPSPDDLVTAPVTIVGIAILPNELDGTSGSLTVTGAFADRYRDRVLGCDAGMFQLENDLADTAAFWTGAKQIAPEAFGFDTLTEKTIAERATSLQAVMLRLFGGLAALAALLVLGQVLTRRTLLGATDAPVLRALGMSRGQLVRAALLPAAVVAVLAVAIAVGGAVALSVFTPLGEARVFEAEPGVFVAPQVLVVGAVAIVLAVMGCVGIPAWRTSKDPGSMLGTTEFSGSTKRSRTASAMASIGLPVSAVAGTRMALEPGHGRTSTPVRSAIVGLTLAVTAMVAAFGFAASMDRFTSSPTLWGIQFDFATGHPFIGATFQDEAIPVVTGDPDVASVTAGNFQEQIGLVGPKSTQPVAVWGTEVLKGAEINLTMLDGHWPRSADEIAVGLQTARALGVGLGDTVQAQLEGSRKELTVVGIPVFPDFGFGPGLGQGAGATMDLLREFYPEATLNLAFARFATGVDRAAAFARINDELQQVNGDLGVIGSDTHELGVSLTNTRKSRGLPLVLAGLFAVVAFATLVHVLVTSVRRRRRDLAILRTIGFRRRQIAATIAWQATTMAVIALLIGVPLGFLVGRFTWALFADRLGVVSVPVEAWTSVAIVIPTVLILANLVAIGPALFARRTQPAQILRAE